MRNHTLSGPLFDPLTGLVPSAAASRTESALPSDEALHPEGATAAELWGLERASRHADEEFANAASHAVGVVLACAALPTLALGVSPDEPARRLGMLVFAATMLMVYLASSIFHALPVGRAKAVLRRVDHAAIFVFIAGSFTPFALSPGQAGGSLGPLAVIWAAAALGVTLKLFDKLRHRSLSTVMYLLFGWVVMAAAQPMLHSMPDATQTLVLVGGAAYNIGCVFYMLDRRLPYAHLVWHLFVLAGSACHFVALMLHAS